MVKSCFCLNIIAIVITVAITCVIVLPIFGIQVGVVRDWVMVVK